MNLCLVPYRFHETSRSLKDKVRVKIVMEGSDRVLLNSVYEKLTLDLDAFVYCISSETQPCEIRMVLVVSKK